jgi:hypothetical protein
MKTIAVILALAATTVAAIPTSEDSKLVAGEPDCQLCIDKYDFCVDVSLDQKATHIGHILTPP